MKAKLFSVNAIADAFRKDRATVVRAMRGVKPDAHDRGHPRYFWDTAVNALRQHEALNNPIASNADAGMRRRIGEIGEEVEQITAELDELCETIRSIETLEARQPYSRKGGPLIEKIKLLLLEAVEIEEKLEDGRASLLRFAIDDLIGEELTKLITAVWKERDPDELLEEIQVDFLKKELSKRAKQKRESSKRA